jgi:hypothetical protein
VKQILAHIVEPQIEEAIKDSGILDDYCYEVSLSVFPTPQGPQPVLAIVLGVPNPAEVGTKLTAMTLVPGPIPAEIAITTAVLGLINALLEQRQQALGQPPQKQQISGSGLILP